MPVANTSRRNHSPVKGLIRECTMLSYDLVFRVFVDTPVIVAVTGKLPDLLRWRSLAVQVAEDDDVVVDTFTVFGALVTFGGSVAHCSGKFLDLVVKMDDNPAVPYA